MQDAKSAHKYGLSVLEGKAESHTHSMLLWSILQTLKFESLFLPLLLPLQCLLKIDTGAESRRKSQDEFGQTPVSELGLIYTYFSMETEDKVDSSYGSSVTWSVGW